MHDQYQPSSPSRFGSLLSKAAWAVQIPLLLAALTMVGYAAAPLFRHVPKPATQPATMENVDWSSEKSSMYCLACHKDVAQATAGRDVEQGHSHNVPLNADQLEAVKAMGTVTGPNNVLICMSCHRLGNENPHMLGDTLGGSKLCKGCHPGQFTMVGTPHDLRISAPDEQNRFGQTAESGGPCSACHLSHHYARDFEHSGLDPDGRCVTCHKIGRAAAKHARPTMEHPESHCVVCHNPHDATHSNFLKKPAAEVCRDCHSDYFAGPEKGMHPLGAMKYDVPRQLVDAGARTFGKSKELTCLVCHSTHSSTHQPLLVLSPESNDLCLSCHGPELAKLGSDGRMPKHGQGGKLTDEQKAVVEGRNGRVGPKGELLCISCHNVHHAPQKTDLLSFQPSAEDGCTACHPGQSGVIGTGHDLRTSRPNEKNLAGLTPVAGGPCSSCHMGHGSARTARPSDADVTGHCMTCHHEGGPAPAKHESFASGHPGTNCIACHNPHEHETGDFLVKSKSELCSQCHAAQSSLAGGPHDPAQNAEAWEKLTNGRDEGPCLTCHVAHGKKGSGLFSFDAVADGNHDSACLHCHQDAAWNAASDIAAIHPQKIHPDQKLVPVALVPHDDKGNLRMGCRTCHNPHGSAEPAHLARVEKDQPTASLCLHCHDDKKLIEMTGHATSKLAGVGFDTDSCKPCHAMHARPQDAWGQMLSPRFLTQATTQPATQPSNETAGQIATASAAERAPTVREGSTQDHNRAPNNPYAHEAAVPCLVCHHSGGTAPVRDIATHPPVTIVNIIKPDEPGYLPVFNADGKVDVNGQITCRTCHLSHGQTELLQQAAANGQLTPDEQRSAHMQLRPFTGANLCTQCHGAQARLKFLFFHNLEQRTRK